MVLLLGLATAAARSLPLTDLSALILAAGAPYLPFALLVALALTVRGHRWVVASLLSLLLVWNAVVQWPWYYIAEPVPVAAEHREIRVLSSNLLHGLARTDSFVALATDDADVIATSELTAEAVGRFREAGLSKRFPYSIVIPRPGAGGMGLWSRYPLTALPASKYGNNFIAARMHVPGVAEAPLVVSVHLMSPLARGDNTFDAWLHRITAARSEFADYAKAAGPAAVIIAGDFNSTVDMRQFRDLLDVGYQEAVRQTGAGFGPTYSPHPRIPPLITIDHVLTRNSTATSIHTVDVPGSDHRALLATVAVPRDPSAP